jgi:uncharacterized protein (DUF2141 family)
MNRLIVLLSIALAACGPAPVTTPPPTIQLGPGTGVLAATVSHVKAGKGLVWCALHVSADAFPNASPVIGGSVKVESTAEQVQCRFAGLPAGTYALSLFQDENANGALDVNAFGAPTEGYGASRNNLPAAAAPTFADNQVTLADGEELTLDITLR